MTAQINSLPTNTPIAFRKVGKITFSAPVFGTVRHDDETGKIEVLLGATVDAAGKVTSARRGKVADADRWYVGKTTQVDATVLRGLDELPAGLVGTKRCSMAEDHKQYATDSTAKAVMPDGSVLRFIQRNGSTKCVVCARKDAAVAAAKRKAAKAAAAAAAEKAEQDRLAAAAAAATEAVA